MLLKNGVPFHAAFGMSSDEAASMRLDAIERTAFTICFGILEGGDFDWRAMQFKERK